MIDGLLGGAGSDCAAFVTVAAGDTVEFFRVENPAAPVVTPDGTGAGEGYLYLGRCIDGGATSGPHVAAGSDADPAPGKVRATLLASGVSKGDLVTATATASGGTSEFATNVAANAIEIVKRAFELDGTPIASASTMPKGSRINYLLYVNNPGGAVTDVSLQDVLDPGFLYLTGTMRFDNSVDACADQICTPAEEAAVFGATDGGTAGTDAVNGGDVVGFGGVTIDAGDEVAANARLDIAAGKVWALAFTVKVN